MRHGMCGTQYIAAQMVNLFQYRMGMLLQGAMMCAVFWYLSLDIAMQTSPTRPRQARNKEGVAALELLASLAAPPRGAEL